ncbi:MAG: ABC transporter permease [Gammaproteobacteria bacterium]|nr:ABC transporter permease [Gammaproteobacteria bacterium]
MYLEARRDGERLLLEFTGAWRAADLPAIGAALEGLDFAGARQAMLSTTRLEALDLTGAWRMRELVGHLRSLGCEVAFDGAEPDQLRLVNETLGGVQHAPQPSEPRPDTWAELAPLAMIGRRVLRGWEGMLDGSDFVGRVSVALGAALTSARRLRPTSIVRHVFDTGLMAIPIVALIAFLISVIVAYISAQQLQKFGAEIFVVDLITISVLREMGVLLTAIIVAGRSGSAFAAEIGAMKLNEEVDALRATGVEPIEVLVLPRVLGLVIALPLLTMIADAVGLTGGAILCKLLLDMPIVQYLQRANDAIGTTTFWVGIIKAPVFALLISLAGTFRGLQVRGSSRELGRLTTVAVVQSIFLVILADALFAVVFMELDI